MRVLVWMCVLGLALPACASKNDGSNADETSATSETTAEETETGASTSTEETGESCQPEGEGCWAAPCCGELECVEGVCIAEDSTDDGNTTMFVVPDDTIVCGPPGPNGTSPRCLCDIWNPEGDCPEGEKCTAYATAGSSWDANKCVMVMGDGQPGDDCTATDGSGVSGNDDCESGSMCWDINQDTMTGYCLSFCQGSPNNPMCAGDTMCAIYNNGVLPLCLPVCDPLNGGADCPNAGNLCISDPGGSGFVCVLDASGGMGTYGTECQYANSCNQGLFCADAAAVPNCQGAQGCCSEFCEVGQPNTCSGMGGGQECVPWWEMGMAPPGYEHVGGCAIPG